jgi:hypothetical protein
MINVRDYIAGLPEDERQEIKRQAEELRAAMDGPIDCSDIPEITELGPRPERDAEGRLIMRPELREIFDERWEKDEPGYRFLKDH